MRSENHYAVFLRAVNVGGHSAVNMNELTECLTGNSYKEVSSYINSGNLLVCSQYNKEEARTNITELIRHNFSLETEVFIKTLSDLKQILSDDRFDPLVALKDSYKMVIMLSRRINSSEIEALLKKRQFEEMVYSRDDILYVYYPIGSGKSKLSVSLIERNLNLKATARNWNTIRKITELIAVSQDSYQ